MAIIIARIASASAQIPAPYYDDAVSGTIVYLDICALKCSVDVAPATEERARLLAGLGFGALDALHLASAEQAEARWFVTTDDRLIKNRLGAIVVTLLIIAVAVRTRPPLRRFAFALLGIVSLQIWLGAKVVWNGAGNIRLYHSMVGDAALHQASITSFHVMTGAATLAVSLLLALSANTLAHRRDATSSLIPHPSSLSEVPA